MWIELIKLQMICVVCVCLGFNNFLNISWNIVYMCYRRQRVRDTESIELRLYICFSGVTILFFSFIIIIIIQVMRFEFDCKLWHRSD